MKRLLWVVIPLMMASFLMACSTNNNAISSEAVNSTNSENNSGELFLSDEFVYPATNVAEAYMIRPTDHVIGAENPKVLIIEYGDLQCPACAGVATTLHDLAERMGDDVAIVFRHFPLKTIHPNAVKAAEAAEAAGEQGKFWEYHDHLYGDQNYWAGLSEKKANTYFKDVAKDLDLDKDAFADVLDSGKYNAYVEASYQEAVNLGFTSTPSAIFEGQTASGLPTDYGVWKNMVEQSSGISDLLPARYTKPPVMSIDTTKNIEALVTLEDGGTFKLELYPQSAPLSVNNFVFLAKKGWYDGVTFHRVIEGFVAQTGDPSGTGVGGPGYYIPNEIDETLSHSEEGVVAMARNNTLHSNGSQWYITLGDASETLDGLYTIFGKVTEGMDVVNGIRPRNAADNPNVRPGIVIESINILE